MSSNKAFRSFVNPDQNRKILTAPLLIHSTQPIPQLKFQEKSLQISHITPNKFQEQPLTDRTSASHKTFRHNDTAPQQSSMDRGLTSTASKTRLVTETEGYLHFKDNTGVSSESAVKPLKRNNTLDNPERFSLTNNFILPEFVAAPVIPEATTFETSRHSPEHDAPPFSNKISIEEAVEGCLEMNETTTTLSVPKQSQNNFKQTQLKDTPNRRIIPEPSKPDWHRSSGFRYQSPAPNHETEGVSSTALVRNMSAQLNEKQRKIAELEEKLTKCRNTADSLDANNSREMRKKIRDIEVLELTRQNQEATIRAYELQMMDLKKQTLSYYTTAENCRNLEALLKGQVEDLLKLKENQQLALEGFNIHVISQVNDDAINEIKAHLQQKSEEVLQLTTLNQKLSFDNNSLMRQVEFLTEKTEELQRPMGTLWLGKDHEFSVFEDSLKTYMREAQKQKTLASLKQEEFDRLKETQTCTRIENQRLKNQLKIECLRRVSELRSSEKVLDIQKHSLSNQIRELRHQLNVAQERIKSLSSEVKEKDHFIMKNVKVAK